jgi:hypothetical protein
MCHGEAQAVFLVAHELAPDRTSFRVTGEMYLVEECVAKYTEDVHHPRSHGCGAKARRARVMYTPGLTPEQEGRRLVG